MAADGGSGKRDTDRDLEVVKYDIIRSDYPVFHRIENFKLTVPIGRWLPADCRMADNFSWGQINPKKKNLRSENLALSDNCLRQ